MRILLVDDSEDMLDVLELLFEDDTIYKTTDPAKAKNIINKVGIDLVITDLQMPSMSGFDLALEIRKDNLQIPIIIFTALDKELAHTLPLSQISDLYFVGDKDISQLMSVVQTLSKRYTLPFGTKE